MFAEFSLLPEQASTAARRVDALLVFLLSVSTAISLLVFVLIVTFSIKYRRRPGNERPPRIHGSNKLETIWTAIPLVLGLVMFVWGANVYLYISRPPPDAMEVYVVAKQWMWKIQHPEGQREINELHVPVNQPVKVTLTSEDVIHDFFVPAFRVKVDVLPGRYVNTWFQATKTGRFDLFCAVLRSEPLRHDRDRGRHETGRIPGMADQPRRRLDRPGRAQALPQVPVRKLS